MYLLNSYFGEEGDVIKSFIYRIFILSVLSVSLYGYSSVTIVKYEGGISFYGKVAEAKIVLKEDLEKGIYRMEVTASSIGLVKTLTSNREDSFVSEGRVVDGVYLPDKFTKLTTKNNYLKRTTYKFDYKQNRVLKETYLEELKDESYYDISKVKMVTQENLVKSTKSKYLKLKKNDFISLYLNLSYGNMRAGDVSYIDQKDSDKVSLLNQNSFEVNKENGEDIYRINMLGDDSLFFDKAVAIDIGFYGDAYVKKISEIKVF